MVQKGDEVVVLTEELGLSSTSVQKGDDVVVHDDKLARGPSSVQKGDSVAVVGEELGQGPSGGLRIGKISADDRMVVQGTQVLFFVPIENTTDTDMDYTLQFTENGDNFDTDTNTIKANSTKAFGTDATKNSPQNNVYGGPEIPNTVGVTWFKGIKPGSITLDPTVNAVGGTKTVEITIGNVGSSALDADVKIRENGGVIYETTITVSSGGSQTVSTTVTKNTETKADYTATVKEIATGLTGTTNPATGYWTDDTVSYPGVYIGDNEISSGPNNYYLNDGDKLPAGTYVLSVDGPNPGWTHVDPLGNGNLDFAPWESRYEPGDYASSEPYAIYTSGSVIFGPAFVWDDGPFDTGGGPGTYQGDLFSGGTGATLVLDDSTTLSFFNMDTQGDYGDNRADLTYSLEKIPASLED